MRMASTLMFLAVAISHAWSADGFDKNCVFAAARQLPVIQGTEIKASRIIPDPNSLQPGAGNTRFVEIDVAAAGQTATYRFTCLIKETTIHAILLGMQ
jgi:hypothetical protein